MPVYMLCVPCVPGAIKSPGTELQGSKPSCEFWEQNLSPLRSSQHS